MVITSELVGKYVMCFSATNSKSVCYISPNGGGCCHTKKCPKCLATHLFSLFYLYSEMNWILNWIWLLKLWNSFIQQLKTSYKMKFPHRQEPLVNDKDQFWKHQYIVVNPVALQSWIWINTVVFLLVPTSNLTVTELRIWFGTGDCNNQLCSVVEMANG